MLRKCGAFDGLPLASTAVPLAVALPAEAVGARDDELLVSLPSGNRVDNI